MRSAGVPPAMSAQREQGFIVAPHGALREERPRSLLWRPKRYPDLVGIQTPLPN